MIKFRYLLTVLNLLVVFFGYGQGIFENETKELEADTNKRIEFNGFVRASGFGGTELYDYSSVFGEFCLQSKLSQGNAFLYADLRFRNGTAFDETFSDFQLKEAYAGWQSDKFDLLLGNQIVSWGRTDGFNPTNNITPNDYFFLTAEPDDQKLSNFMFRMKYRFTPVIELEIIGIPFYMPSNYRFELFDIGENVNFNKTLLPEKSFENSSYAARLNFDFSIVSFSVSYFKGYDTFHGFDVQSIDFSTDTPTVINIATPYLKNTLGADFSFPVGSWILRSEAAYNITNDYEEFMYIPNPDISYVAALEHNFWGVTSIFQYIGKYTLDFTKLQKPVLSDPANPLAQMQYAEEMIIYKSTLFNRKQFYQQKETNHAVMLSLSKNFAYDTWNAEFAGYYNISSEELMIRPKITYKPIDAFSFSLGGAYMTGADETIFSYSAPVLSGVFFELKATF